MKKTTFFYIFIILTKLMRSDLVNPSCKFSNRISICKICCCENLYSIKCTNAIFHSEKKTAVFDLESNHFNGMQSNLTSLLIDWDTTDIHFRIDQKAFSNLSGLQMLTLNKIKDLTCVPNLQNQPLLKEITITNSGLKKIDSNFCITNDELKAINFSENELESNQLENIFLNCEQLNVLDLSYNNLVSLEKIFSYVLSLSLLNLKNNLIEKITSEDLDFMVELTELNLSNNRIKFIGEKAFYSLSKLKRLYLNKNRLETFSDKYMVALDFIDLSHNKLKKLETDFCLSKPFLKKVLFSKNLLRTEALIGTFNSSCSNLTYLDLSYNNLESLNGIFNDSLGLTFLTISDNKLKQINKNDFNFLNKLNQLSLAGNKLTFIHAKAFDPIKALKILDLKNNNLIILPQESLIYGSLVIFDISENKKLVEFPDETQFYKLEELRVHYPYHCCQFLKRNGKQYQDNALNLRSIGSAESVSEIEEISNILLILNSTDDVPSENRLVASPVEAIPDPNDIIIDLGNDFYESIIYKNKIYNTVRCIPEPDPFQPCENLLEGTWLRSSVWFISVMGIMSNLSVIGFNIIYNTNYYYHNVDINVPSFLLANLAIGDFLMSIYLLFIAVKDSSSRSSFGKSALEWQQSFSCNFAGFLSVASSVSSALGLAFITFERYYAITNSINFNKRVTFKFSLLTVILIWIISILFSFLPLVNINSYSAYAICLPLDIRGTTYQIYVFGLNSLFTICFLFICTFYALIFMKTTFRKRKTSLPECSDQMKLRNAEDQKLARNILVLLTVNIVCWGPVVLFCTYSIIKSNNSMNRTYLKIIAIFLIPFNSLINPFLYCITTKSFRDYIRDYLERFKLKRNVGTNISVKSTYSSFSIKRMSHKNSLAASLHRNSKGV